MAFLFDPKEVDNLRKDLRSFSFLGNPIDPPKALEWFDQLDARNHRLGRKFNPADPEVSLAQDKVFFFSRTTINNLLNPANVSHLVIGIVCGRKKTEKYGNLQPLLFAVKGLDDEEPLGNVFRPHGNAANATNPNNPNDNQGNPLRLRLTKLQMNFLRRNMLLEFIDLKPPAPGIFKAFNEFIGFSHSRAEWNALINPPGGPTTTAIAVVLGVDFPDTDSRGKTKPMLKAFPDINGGTAADFESNLRTRLGTYTLFDNGGQCCPNET